MKIKNLSIVSTIIITILFTSLNFGQAPEKPMSPKRPMMLMKHDMSCLTDNLNLTDKQKEQIQKMKIDFEKKMVDLKANLQKDQLEMKEIQTSDNINRSAVLDAVRNINSSKAAIATAMANHKMDVYDILTPDQRKVWKEMKSKNMFGKKGMKSKMRNKMKKNFKNRINN